MAYQQYLMNNGASIYYAPLFRKTIEDHLLYLKSHPNTRMVQVRAVEINRYTGNLFGYLVELKIPMYMHWIVMRCSGYKSPLEFTIDDLRPLYVPNEGLIDFLRQKALSVSA